MGTYPIVAYFSGFCLLTGVIGVTSAYGNDLENNAEYIDLEKAEHDYQTGTQTAEEVNAFRQPSALLPKEKIDEPFSGTVAYGAFSQYNSYGLVIQPQGVSSQPFLNLRYRVFKNEKPNTWLNSATIFLTTWSDFSSNRNLANPSSAYQNFTETDLIVGTSAVLYKKLNASLQLVSYVSPAGAYGFGSWARGTLVYNDSVPAKAFSLKPQASLVYTLPAASSISIESSAFLFEPGITPNWNIRISNKYPANISLPIRLGLGNKFYGGSTFGFTSVGPQLSVMLPGLSGKSFSTNLNAGYLYYYVGPTAADYAGGGGRRNQHVYNIGISVNF